MAFYCNGKKDVCECDNLCADCQHYDNTGGKKWQTNADRIRAMSDEELARFLADKIANENTLSWLRLYDKANIHSATEIEAIRYQWYGYWMQWLKQPAEGE